MMNNGTYPLMSLLLCVSVRPTSGLLRYTLPAVVSKRDVGRLWGDSLSGSCLPGHDSNNIAASASIFLLVVAAPLRWSASLVERDGTLHPLSLPSSWLLLFVARAFFMDGFSGSLECVLASL